MRFRWPADQSPRMFYADDQMAPGATNSAAMRAGRRCRFARAVETDLLEEEPWSVETGGNRLSFSIKPYEIRTFLVTLR